jgi:hypothetical protein
MNNFLTGLMFGAGFGAWIYAMMMRQTGGQVKPSLTVGAIAGVIGLFVIYTLLRSVFPA